ncbi:leucine--tRNA ligase [Agriterribacter sp.]|uniref:leucine--tRNA ligase n=1 Tax=Agriterribacter sp. TaxID=2821509 RepID=UPI002C6C2262|nr:class I tRNA ligase family protein [Agriterribacter sp.]HTN07857.1 class I tRNA ligase family protein [Agriterribacter sp.]
MEYNFKAIEQRWQQQWKKEEVYKVSNNASKPKYYVLDMFPYPSGAGLHVGHPLGYIASDIFARYKRLKGFNVLHPMGYDAFGLPAEQYAIDHGIHPAVSTENNINTFRKQLDNIGFCYDWSREIRTSDPSYYKWTQWIFLQLFKSWYNRDTKKAESIDKLTTIFEAEGNVNYEIPNPKFQIPNFKSQIFSASAWKGFDEATQQAILMEYRLAYCGYGEVNWCEALGTVLANDEVINGVSERGGYPVVKKKLRQWYLRITEYADRLQGDLDTLEWSDAMKEMQTNWIGKSSGAEIKFPLASPPSPLLPERADADSPRTGRFFKTADTNWHILKEYGRLNRQNPTAAEDALWQHIRNNKLGVKVRRQHAVQGYIVDFALLEVKLIIEVDGEYHNVEQQKIYDEARTGYLNEFGLNLIRFSNDEVLNDIHSVIGKIQEEIQVQKKNSSDHAGFPLVSKEKGLGDEAKREAEVKVYTTRPDTIFGVDFMVLAPEHELVEQITTAEQKAAVEEYVAYVKSRSERERMAEKKITGCFTGAYAANPVSGKHIPVWISEYVLAGYGTGAIMAVPCGDERDHKFAKHFNIPVTNIIGDYYNGEEANSTKEAVLQNSGFLDGMVMKDAGEVVIQWLEDNEEGVRKVNYKMRDAAFSRQRYWGEPFPIVWKNAGLNDAVGQGIAYPLDESELPLELPHVESYKPGPEGEGPLANIETWTVQHLETNTMPGYAGSSWYFLRYMDPHNDTAFCDRKVSDYWNQVDLYIGGTEHAVGHLLYSRMWTKVLYDLGYIGFNEPFKKLLNQGMIQGSSRLVYRLNKIQRSDPFLHGSSEIIELTQKPIFVSSNLVFEPQDETVIDPIFDSIGERIMQLLRNSKENYDSFYFDNSYCSRLHADVNDVDGAALNIEAFKTFKGGEYANAEFVLEDGSVYSHDLKKSEASFLCDAEIEKMSKSKYNVVNPDVLVEKYGADTFRMYEMFLGPVEQSKPWDTKGIEGVHRFLKKLWRLFYDEQKGKVWTAEQPTADELKVLHRTIKKVEEDTERFSFNTAVSAFMIAVNELSDLQCHKKEILENILVLLTPYAPHIAEELWQRLGNSGNVLDAPYPVFEEKYIIESSKSYPVAINGKTRTDITIALDATQQQVEEMILANAVVQKWLEGKSPKKIIYVKNRMINVVV